MDVKKEMVSSLYKEWSGNPPTEAEESFADNEQDPILSLGFFGGFNVAVAAFGPVLDALEKAGAQMEQVESLLSRDVEFIAALAEVRAALEKGREIVL